MNRSMQSGADVLVVQLGARRQYAMPNALEEAGMLEGLYTDFCGNVGAGKLLQPLRPFAGGRLGKLLDRKPPRDVAQKTRTFPRWTLDMQRALRVSDQAERVRAIDAAQRAAGTAMAKAGFRDADTLLVQLMEARGLLTAAKRRGLTTVTDVNVALSAESIVTRERQKYPGWEADGYFWGDDVIKDMRGERVIDETIEQTDIFLCPSTFVQDDLVENHGVARERTRLMQYAANPRWLDIVPKPKAGRIFFAGESGLRKGIHILAKAASILRESGHDYEFRVAGNAPELVRQRPETSNLTFLGRQSYSDMRREYELADLFAFPSLVEGAAGVTFEAMAAGLPLVTTKAAGSIARDGIDGFIVPESDAEALASTIRNVVEDRELRDKLSRSARERAMQYSWTGFPDRLATAILSDQNVGTETQ